MAAGTLVSRVLGFVRTSLLAVAIGANTTMGDIFEKANTIPNIIYLLLAAGQIEFDDLDEGRIVEVGDRRIVEGNVAVDPDPELDHVDRRPSQSRDCRDTRDLLG